MQAPISLTLPERASGTAVDTISPGWKRGDWLVLAALISGALALRLMFFNGFFGSDDATYLSRAMQIASGIWTSANYNGALRYGYNIPEGMLLALFGASVWSATLWSLLCSLGEIAAVYALAVSYAGRRAAVFAAMILATTPLHIAVATHADADAVVSLFVTLSFALFYVAERRGLPWLFFATGLSMGMVFWAKELAIVTLLAFFSYPLLFRKIDRRWLFVVLGGMVMLALHLILMQLIAGDPFHLFRVVIGQVQHNFIDEHQGQDGVGYYFRYLFLYPAHTWLAPYLVVCAVVSTVQRRDADTAGDGFQRYVLWWTLGLIAVLTFTPVSLHPLRLAMKQSNYLTLFLAPMALLGGLLLARWRAGVVLAVIAVVGGIALGALEQRVYHVFTANSRAAIEFAVSHPDDWVLGTDNNANLAFMSSVLGQHPRLDERFGTFERNRTYRTTALNQAMRQHPIGYAVFDLETLKWRRAEWPGPARPPTCWQPVRVLTPLDDDLSHALLQDAVHLIAMMSAPLGKTIAATLRPLLTPRLATVYRVDARDLWCTH